MTESNLPAVSWLRAGLPITLLLDLGLIVEPRYPAELGAALAREG